MKAGAGISAFAIHEEATMPRPKKPNLDELDEKRMRYAHEEAYAAPPPHRHDEDEEASPLELGGSSGDRFGHLTDRDGSSSW
jgi:hypothetical protein